MTDLEKLEELAAELANGVKSQSDILDPIKLLKKLTLEKLLITEIDEHLGHEKHSVSSLNKKNSGIY